MKKKNLLVISILCIILIIGGIVTTFSIRKKINDKTINIAFYGLSDNFISLIKENIQTNDEIDVVYDILATGNIDLSTISKKYDMLFTWKGEITDALEGSVETIPGNILENIPVSMRNKYCFPILLDHYELDINIPVLEELQMNFPVNQNELNEFLNDSRESVFSPFFCKGGDDRTLLALIGSYIEALGGLNAYNSLIDEMRKAEKLDDFIDFEAGTNGNEIITVRSVLDMFKKWTKDGITHPQWYMANSTDVRVFAEDKQLSGIFMFLSDHRELPYKIISEYQTIQMPRATESIDHGVISPAICAVLISNNSNCKAFLKNLASCDIQSVMSIKTMLAPVHYRAETYDVQSDDVRFWSAACKGGPLPDLSLAVYQRKPEVQKTICKEIRDYLKY